MQLVDPHYEQNPVNKQRHSCFYIQKYPSPFDAQQPFDTLYKGSSDNNERTIFWEYLEQTAVRKGKWKLVLKGKLIDAYGPVPDIHLSNLEEDISESNNLADKEPEITEELKNLAENWRSKIEEKWEKDYGAPNEEQRLNNFQLKFR